MDVLLGSLEGKKEMLEINKNSNQRQSPLMQILKGEGADSGEEVALDSKGCTANMVMIKDNVIYCANAGDSRAVICCNGIAENLSEDHKPENKIERDRIYKAGSVV
jgi:serine/threonine protein phosphatase PrpC